MPITSERTRSTAARRLLAVTLALAALVQAGLGPASVAGTSVPAVRSGAGATVPAEPIYRLRLVVTTTARAARLFLRSPSVLIEADPRRVSRDDRAHFVRYGRGPLVLKNHGGGKASATFIAAVTPGGARRISFTTATRGRGQTTVRATNFNRKPLEPIRRIRARGGRQVMGLDTARVAARGPVAGTEPLSPSVYAFYYMWYEMESWSGGMPIASYNTNPTPYDSSDPAAMDRHIQQAQDAGIDGFIVSWQGSGTETDENLQLLAGRLPPGFDFAVYVEILYPAFTPTKEKLIAQLKYALDTYGDHPNYLRYRGKPLLYVFASRHPLTAFGGGVHPRAAKVWRKVIAALVRDGYDFSLVGEGRHFKADQFELFQGMHPYGTEDPTKTWEFNRSRGLMARAYAAVHGGARRFYAASVIPGYDDMHISGRRNNYYFPHRDGALYREQWAAATGTTPDQTLIVSFNEWPETTNIEPNAEWGSQYLDATAGYTAEFKASR